MRAGLIRLTLHFLATFGVAWGIGLYQIHGKSQPYSRDELALWLIAIPALAMAASLLGHWAWRHIQRRRQVARARAAEKAQTDGRQAAEARARESDRRFDTLLVAEAELLLPAAAYAADFGKALADGAPVAEPADIAYEDEGYLLMARRANLSPPAGLESFHPRARRVAALGEALVARLAGAPTGALRRLGERCAHLDEQEPEIDALTPYWDKGARAPRPAAVLLLLLNPGLADDARPLLDHLEARLPALGWPKGLAVTVQSRLVDATQALMLADDLITQSRQSPQQAHVVLAVDSQFDDHWLREAMARSGTGDPAQWQHRTQAIPSEGGCALVLAPESLAAECGIAALARLKRPVARGPDSESESVPERTLLHEALLRAAPDFDRLPPAAARLWLDADTPDAALRRAILALNSLARPPAVDAFRPPTEPGSEGGPLQEPESLPCRRVFGSLGAVNALGLVAAAAQHPSQCDLIVVGDSASAAIAVIPADA